MSKIRKTRRKLRKRHFSKTNVILSVFLVTFCGVAAWIFHEALYTGAADDWFETNTVNSVAISLPEDDGPHQAAMESWFFKGHLRSESGDLFSFYYAVLLTNDLVSYMVSHASLNDHQTGNHLIAQRKTVGNASVSPENRFEFAQGNWLMAGGNGNGRLKITADDFSFDLSAASTRAPIFHGGSGIISTADTSSSYYYTRPRMAISGTLLLGETAEKVKGIAWFDHQWGDISDGLLSRAWFGLQFKDGTDLMIYQLPDKSNRPVGYTGSISQNGFTEVLLETDVTVVPGEKWTSSNSNITYPVVWTIDIPKKNISITLQGISKNNEFDATLTSYNIYWEGPVEIQGSHAGLGFMRLNYMDEKK